jgi:hypothetical protein
VDIVAIVKGAIDMAWNDEDSAVTAPPKSALLSTFCGLPLDPAGCPIEYFMPCIPVDGIVPANACMALSSINEVTTS